MCRRTKYIPAYQRFVKRSTIRKTARVEKAKRSLRVRLLNRAAPTVHISPLHFRNVTKHVSVSEGEKEE